MGTVVINRLLLISIYSSAAYNTSFPMMRMDNVCALYRLEHTCTEYYLNPLFILNYFKNVNNLRRFNNWLLLTYIELINHPEI